MSTLLDLKDTVDQIDRLVTRLDAMHRPPVCERWDYELTGFELDERTCTNVWVTYTLEREDEALVPEILHIYGDEWVRLTWDVRHRIAEAFYDDWRQGKVRFEI
mgnify:CR=1 FL=1